MKYIRTKNEIIEVNPTLTDEQIDIAEGKNTPRADTIEELCDEAVIVDNRPPKTKRLLDNFEKAFMFKNHCRIRNEDIIIYGAIWTDKGLIYVAEMNDKGELELL